MNTEAYRNVENLVEGYTPLWIDRLGLNHWTIVNVFLDTLYIDDPVTNNYMVVADTEVEWSYMDARINWYLPSAVRLAAERLERTVVHELCHVALSPEQAMLEAKVEEAQEGSEHHEKTLLEKLMYDRMELATEAMTKSVMRAWKYGSSFDHGPVGDAGDPPGAPDWGKLSG